MSQFPEVKALEQEVTPPELLADPNNPLNDPYYDSLRDARRLCVALAARLRPKHQQIAKLAHTGVEPKVIAEQTGAALGTVYKTLKRPEVQKLIEALRFTASLVDGPNLALRKNVLWRIAQRSELDEPTVTIAAIKELNKLDGAYPAPAPPTSPNVNITINAEALPRTALDAEPE